MKTAAAWRRRDAYPHAPASHGRRGRSGTGQCSGRVAALAGGKRIWPSGPLSAVPRRSCKLVTFTGCGPLELTPNGIISYLTRPGISNTTKATYHASVRTYCRYLVLRGQRQDDPCMGTHG
jgi:hypothetical protein